MGAQEVGKEEDDLADLGEDVGDEVDRGGLVVVAGGLQQLFMRLRSRQSRSAAHRRGLDRSEGSPCS
jgi:hypothetical protein